MNIKRLSYALALCGVLTGALLSVRIGALIIAAGIILFLSPDVGSMRPSQKVIPIALVIALIAIALALPRG
ncbi:MAG: hypothetical protein FJW91_04940 [Actinobacteria bacterium]|nr:hypothetical protein [Actinomycetota bacterium]